MSVRIAGDVRYIAVEDAARYRDALGVPLPPGIPESLLDPVRDPLGDLALRYARTHAPFTAADFASALRPGVAAAAEAILVRLADRERGSSKASSGLAARGANGPIPACCA